MAITRMLRDRNDFLNVVQIPSNSKLGRCYTLINTPWKSLGVHNISLGLSRGLVVRVGCIPFVLSDLGLDHIDFDR
jgi:hypothetical protein